MDPAVTLASEMRDVIPVVAIVFGLTFAGVCAVVSAIKSVLMSRQHEQSRREIAAYVAEGSMTPEEGERLLNAGQRFGECGTRKRKVMEAIVEALAEQPGLLIPIVSLALGIPLAAFGLYAWVATEREKERTRREVAAYVAEGSMTPEDAAKLLSTGSTLAALRRGGCCGGKRHG